MTLDEYLRHRHDDGAGQLPFDAEAIKAFARKYDPQPFHVDEEAARESVFGRLCASGWHTAAMWMKLNLAHRGPDWDGPGPAPEFGPSPGFKNLKWLKPVYAGETVTFTRIGARSPAAGLASRLEPADDPLRGLRLDRRQGASNSTARCW